MGTIRRDIIKVIDLDFNYLGSIGDYKTPYFTRKWSTAGQFEIDIDNLNHINKIQEDNILFIDPSKPFIIESFDIDIDEETILIKGRELKSILDRRITIPPTGQGYDHINDDCETIMKGYVDRNAVTTASSRVINNLQIATNQNRGISTVYQTRYANLLDELETLSLYSGLGYFITLDLENKKFIFDVYEGVDRTATQSDNSRAIFTKDLGNIINQDYKVDWKNYKNFAVVGGQGEEEDRQIIEVEENAANTGIKRREVFIDARDTNDDTTLEDRGKSKLSEYTKVVTLDTEAKELSFLYDIGDIVTALDSKIGLSLDTRIIELTENYDNDGLSINPVFGSNIPTFNTLLKKIKNSAQETKKEIYSSSEPSSIAIGDYWIEIL